MECFCGLINYVAVAQLCLGSVKLLSPEVFGWREVFDSAFYVQSSGELAMSETLCSDLSFPFPCKFQAVSFADLEHLKTHLT